MRRRSFLGALGGVAAAWPFAARGQNPVKRTIGWLSVRSANTETETHILSALREGIWRSSSGLAMGNMTGCLHWPLISCA
jgi:hypothetical protein